jgi:hypothetical protein
LVRAMHLRFQAQIRRRFPMRCNFVVALPWHRKKLSISNVLLSSPVGPLS